MLKNEKQYSLIYYIIILSSIILLETIPLELGIAKVSDLSMVPNLSKNQNVLYLKHARINHGSVVVINTNTSQFYLHHTPVNRPLICRVIGLPGDKIDSRKASLYVNDRKINQDYINQSQTNEGIGNWNLENISIENSWLIDGSIHVPPHMYFVLGDNRSIAKDSRVYGFISRGSIDGVVKVPIWSNKSTRKVINKQWEDFYYLP